MKLRSGCPDLLGQGRFDVHVDVFETGPETKFVRFDLGFDLPKTFRNGAFFRLVDDAGIRQGSGMRNRPLDIIGIETPIVGDRLSVTLHQV